HKAGTQMQRKSSFPSASIDGVVAGETHYDGSEYSPRVARPPEVIPKWVRGSTSCVIDEPLGREKEHHSQPASRDQQLLVPPHDKLECAIKIFLQSNQC